MAYGTSDYLRDTAVADVTTTNAGANGQLTGKAAVVVLGVAGGGALTGPSGTTVVGPTALVTSTINATAFAPSAGRTFYLVLTGTGSVTVTPVYSRNATDFYPEATAVDGGAPIILNQVAYNGGTQNGIRIPLVVDEYGVTVKVLPGVVTGTVNFTFVQ